MVNPTNLSDPTDLRNEFRETFNAETNVGYGYTVTKSQSAAKFWFRIEWNWGGISSAF